jgi:hypothetical protein
MKNLSNIRGRYNHDGVRGEVDTPDLPNKMRNRSDKSSTMTLSS